MKTSDSGPQLNILIVDDEKNIRTTLAITLSDHKHNVTQASSVKEALSFIKERSFDLILTDYRMEGMTGLDLLQQVEAIGQGIPMVMMTAYGSIENAIAATKAGVFDYLQKPFSTSQVLHLVKKVQQITALKQENVRLKGESSVKTYFSGFTSPAMARLEDFINSVAPADETILLTGESGTGKTALARLVHDRSKRASKPFVTVYCTTLAESVLESELFGHTKGAFTGADHDKPGKIDAAEGGTLFLDEIGELSLQAQAKLLRFLQEHVIERVGGRKEIRVNARVIAATNKDLREAVAAGKFREDLYFRINILECELVPLRHRKEDLPILIDRLLQEAIAHMGTPTSIPENIMQELLRYEWPGNIRELKNVIERLTILSRTRPMNLSDLPQTVRFPSTSFRTATGTSLVSLEALEKQHIIEVLNVEPNQERAAKILGITTVTLWKKRKAYGLP